MGVVVQANNTDVPFLSCHITHITDNFSWTPLFPVLSWLGKEERRSCDDSDEHRISDPSS